MSGDAKLVEAMPSELDYWSPQMYQSAIVSEFTRDFLPLSTLQDYQPIDFYIRGAYGLFLDLNNSKFEINAKITKPDGEAIADNTAAPMNLLLHSMFSTVEIELNGKPMAEPNNLYPFRAFLETMTNYRKEVMETRLLTEGWVKDTAGHVAVTDPTGTNVGLKSRMEFTKGSRVVQLIGRPHLDMFHINNLLPHNIEVRIRFSPQKPPFVIKAKDAGIAFNFKIISAKLHILTKQIAPSLLLAHAQMLGSTPYRIPYNKETLKTIAIPGGTQNYEQDNVYMGVLPDLVIVAFITDACLTGGYNVNPFNFQHFNTNYLALKVNGELVPRVPLTPDFTTGQYISEYTHNLEALGYDKGNHCWDLTPSDWASGYTIWAFKITPGPIGSVRSAPRNGAIRLEVKFGTPLAANISALLLEQHPALLEIDQVGSIMTG